MRIRAIAIASAMLLVFVAGCGGSSTEEQLVEQIIEQSGGDVGNVDIDTSGDDFNMTVEGDDGETIDISGTGDDGDFDMTIEGGDGETINVTGSGDDDEFNMTIEGEDGQTMTIGGGEIPEGLQTPVADGGNVTSTMTASGMATVALEYPAAMFDELVAMYDGVFTGDDVQRFQTSNAGSDGEMRSVTWAAGSGTQVTVADCAAMGGDSDAACVSILEISE